jgi:hypothetical protein
VSFGKLANTVLGTWSTVPLANQRTAMWSLRSTTCSLSPANNGPSPSWLSGWLYRWLVLDALMKNEARNATR